MSTTTNTTATKTTNNAKKPVGPVTKVTLIEAPEPIKEPKESTIRRNCIIADEMYTELDTELKGTRQPGYKPQLGVKAVLSLKDFTDESLFGELRRRGWSGQLTYTKTAMV